MSASLKLAPSQQPHQEKQLVYTLDSRKQRLPRSWSLCPRATVVPPTSTMSGVFHWRSAAVGFPEDLRSHAHPFWTQAVPTNGFARIQQALVNKVLQLIPGVRVPDVAERCSPHLRPHAAKSVHSHRRRPSSRQHVSLFTSGGDADKKESVSIATAAWGPVVHLAMSSVMSCVHSRGAISKLALRGAPATPSGQAGLHHASERGCLRLRIAAASVRPPTRLPRPSSTCGLNDHICRDTSMPRSMCCTLSVNPSQHRARVVPLVRNNRDTAMQDAFLRIELGRLTRRSLLLSPTRNRDVSRPANTRVVKGSAHDAPSTVGTRCCTTSYTSTALCGNCSCGVSLHGVLSSLRWGSKNVPPLCQMN